MTIDFWLLDLKQIKPHCFDFYYQQLSEDEIKHGNSYRFTTDKNYYTISRGILKRILSSYLHISLAKKAFKYNNYGKPFLCGNELFFNVSHCKHILALAVTPDSEIGLDIEIYDKNFNNDFVSTTICTEKERSFLNRYPQNKKNEMFLKLWTMKEAYLKQAGKGFSVDPRRIELHQEFDKFENELVKIDKEVLFRKTSLRFWEIKGNYRIYCALCSNYNKVLEINSRSYEELFQG